MRPSSPNGQRRCRGPAGRCCHRPASRSLSDLEVTDALGASRMATQAWVLALVLAVATLIERGYSSLECAYSSRSLDERPRTGGIATYGCLFELNVSKAVAMECDYSDMIYYPRANFRAGQLPPTIRTIRIVNASQISIACDAFSSLYNLQNIYIGNIQTLQIWRNSWAQIERPQEVTITIEHVSQLILNSGTFSGWSNPGPNIVIRNVAECFVEASAFDPGSTIQKLTFEDIGNLWLKNGSFQAEIEQLELRNVSLPDGCQSGFFGGRIGNLSLSLVWMGEAYSGCLQAEEGWGSLEVRSSSLGNVHGFGISGSINDVIIEDSHLGCINQSGLHLNVSTFTMNLCLVDELASDALDVHFSQSASLQASTITFIRANAFSRMVSRANGASTLTIRRLSVNTSEERSLSFSEQTQPALLDMVLLDSCECGVEQRALQLVVGAAPPRSVTSQQRGTARQIVDQVRCLAGTDTPTLAEFHCQSCPVQDGSTARCSPPKSLRTNEVAVWPSSVVAVVVVVLLLLLIAAGASLVFVKRRRSRQIYPDVSPSRGEHPPPNLQRSNYGEHTPVPEPVDKEILENLQSQDRQTTSAVTASSTTDHRHALEPEPEPEYSEIDAPGLSCPGDSPWLYIEMSSLPAGLPEQPVYANCDDAAQDSSLYENCGAVEGEEHALTVYWNIDE